MPEPHDTIAPPAVTGTRYDRTDGLDMMTRMPLGELMGLADAERRRRFSDGVVTYVVDTNPNYTNVCVTRCAFCAYCRRPGAPDAFTLTPEEVAERTAAAARQGATTVLLQGGHNPKIHLADWVAYISAIRKACPEIHIHPFSPAEYVFMAEQEKIPVTEVLERVYAEGVTTIPGGGAEILVEGVRRQIAPLKATTDQWLDTCEAAHGIGFKTTATMMYGHVETDADIVDHLLRLRDLQDRTGGITSFIAWSFKPGDAPAQHAIAGNGHPARYVRIIAAARLLLDNVAHIQSSWFSESVLAGQLGLVAGADDFGGVLVEENVLRSAGHAPSTTVTQVQDIIRRMGFVPAQRNSDYRVLDA